RPKTRCGRPAGGVGRCGRDDRAVRLGTACLRDGLPPARSVSATRAGPNSMYQLPGLLFLWPPPAGLDKKDSVPSGFRPRRPFPTGFARRLGFPSISKAKSELEFKISAF